MWLGQTGHSASLWMDQVARAVLILELTDSAFMLSLVIAARLVPILLFGLIAGAVADRSNKQRVLFVTQTVTLGTHLFLGVMVTTGLIESWHVFATALVAGTAMAFNQPVRQSLIPMTVPKEDLANAVAQVRNAGLEPGIYTGKYFWQGAMGNTAEWASLPLWHASYWDDRHYQETVDFGGWTKAAAHQYAASPAIAGRDRCYDVIFEEEAEPIGMTPAERARLDRLENLVGAWGYEDRTGTVLKGEAALQAMVDTGVSLALTTQHQNTATLDLAKEVTGALLTGDTSGLTKLIDGMLAALAEVKQELKKGDSAS